MVVVDVAGVEVVVTVAAVGNLLYSAAAAAGGSASTGGRLGLAWAADAGGSTGGPCLLPSAARDGELRSCTRVGPTVAALDGCLVGVAAGLVDNSLHRQAVW